jgi:hypothetical protein
MLGGNGGNETGQPRIEAGRPIVRGKFSIRLGVEVDLDLANRNDDADLRPHPD